MTYQPKIAFVLQDYLGAGIVFTASACSVTSGIYGIVSPGIVGLAVAYALMVSTTENLFNFRSLSELFCLPVLTFVMLVTHISY